MKTCPVCDAKAFDDAEICYGCMHRFDEDAGSVQKTAAPMGAPPEFRIRFVPMREGSGALSWKCAIEV